MTPYLTIQWSTFILFLSHNIKVYFCNFVLKSVLRMTDKEYNQKYSEQGHYDASRNRPWNGVSQDRNHPYNVAYYKELGRQHGYRNTYNSTFAMNENFEKGYLIGKSIFIFFKNLINDMIKVF